MVTVLIFVNSRSQCNGLLLALDTLDVAKVHLRASLLLDVDSISELEVEPVGLLCLAHLECVQNVGLVVVLDLCLDLFFSCAKVGYSLG